MDIKDYFYQFNYIPIPRTAIEAKILFAARVMQVRFLKRLSGKTPREQNSSGKKIGAESAVLHFVFFIVMVNKMQQSAKRKVFLKRNTVPEVFPLTIGSGKTVPFEKRHAGCEEREKINRRRIYDTLRINFFEATKQTACIFSKGDGNMTRKVSTTNLPGARGNAYPNAELDYSLDYEYDPAYAHRLVHAGNRYYRYDANGNITAEKDGPFTEDDAFIFTYNYDPDTDVYGTDYGFGLDAPKETEESHPENLFAYRRNYTWNEKNLLTKSSDRSYTVHYRYGEDGQRALKYTEEGRSETLYFNNFYTIHIPVQDKNNPQGLRVHKHIFVGNSRLVTAMTHTDNNGDNAEQREKRYYYHSDHLGSAQFVTDWRGRQYEHIEYTPYGELWIAEVAAGLDKLPFRFTGKEMDEETGLYYYGARYLDPKYSRWLSGDPALGEYIPKAPIDDEAKKHNENLPGMGGVFNVVNLHLYHYAGNNPVKYTEPDGKITKHEDLNGTDRIKAELKDIVQGSFKYGVFASGSITLWGVIDAGAELNLGRVELSGSINNDVKTKEAIGINLELGVLNFVKGNLNLEKSREVPADEEIGNYLQMVKDIYSKGELTPDIGGKIGQISSSAQDEDVKVGGEAGLFVGIGLWLNLSEIKDFVRGWINGDY